MGAKNTKDFNRGPDFYGERVSGKHISYHSEQVSDGQPSEFLVTATGGVITTYSHPTGGTGRMHTFTGSPTYPAAGQAFDVTQCFGAQPAEVLMVGAGGGCGAESGGGGGGLLLAPDYSLTNGLNFTVHVGLYGGPSPGGGNGTSVGSATTAFGITAGGGGGSSPPGGGGSNGGALGGNGGGGGGTWSGGGGPGGEGGAKTPVPSAFTVYGGNDGGNATAANPYYNGWGGGGGGAGGAGGNANQSTAATGGAGVINSITGVGITYSAGGGGNGNNVADFGSHGAQPNGTGCGCQQPSGTQSSPNSDGYPAKPGSCIIKYKWKNT